MKRTDTTDTYKLSQIMREERKAKEAQHTKGEVKTQDIYIGIGASKYATSRTEDGTQYYCNIYIKARFLCKAYGKTIKETNANANRIVKAVNMHDELVSKLKLFMDYLNPFSEAELMDEVRELLKQAKQK